MFTKENNVCTLLEYGDKYFQDIHSAVLQFGFNEPATQPFLPSIRQAIAAA